MNRPDSTPLLPGIACPTLVIASDEDRLTPTDEARQMESGIPKAELVIIDRAGHLSNFERPEAFNQALRRFLQKWGRD
jgi:pimeloyl-ACP methyl ester carboxylesterase